MEHTVIDTSKLITAIEHNMHAKLQYIPSKIESMNVINCGKTLVVDSGMPSDTFNTAYGGSIDSKTAAEVGAYYRNKQFPMAWWVGPEAESKYDVKTVMEDAGFIHDEHDVGMLCDLKNLELPNYTLPEGLKITQCTKQHHYDDFGIVLSSIFDPVDQYVQQFYKLIGSIPQESRKDLVLFVGYYENKPVSTAAVFMTDVAGIFDVSTMPNQQKRGYGSAMFYTAVEYAKSSGYRHAVLQASPDGLNIYKRFGFETVCNFNVYSNHSHLEGE